MDLTVNLMSLALLLFGSNKLPPNLSYVRQGECPLVQPQEFFQLSKIEGVMYYFNHGTAEGNVLSKYKCITLRIEESQDDYFLHIYAKNIKPGEPDEQSWHTLRPEVAYGRFEIDMRLNKTDQEAHAYLYYNQKPFAKSFFLYTCVYFTRKKTHAVGAVIGSNKPALFPRQVTILRNQLDQLTNLKFSPPGFTLKNLCEDHKSPMKSKKPAENAGKSKRPAENAGKFKRPAENAGKSQNPGIFRRPRPQRGD